MNHNLKSGGSDPRDGREPTFVLSIATHGVTFSLTASFPRVIMSPTELLREFRTTGSGSAFADLTRHYLPLVLGVARRRSNDPAMAEDIVQSVFVKLARSAPAIESDNELTSWLHRTTLNASIDAWRIEARRRERETGAAMDPTLTHAPEPQPWAQIAPEIDGLVQNLPPNDRQIVMLRFFEQLSMAEAGKRVGISEDAAKMRVGRALEKLRTALASKGVTCTAALLADLLDGQLLPHTSAALEQRCADIAARSMPHQPPASDSLPQWATALTAPRVAALVLALAAVGTALRWEVSRSPSPDATPTSTEVSASDTPERITPFGARVLKSLVRSSGQLHTPDLEGARAALKAALNRPPRSSQYPPAALVRALQLFEGRYDAALPILMEAASTADYETRAWSLSGIQYVIQTTPLEPASADMPARHALRDQVRPLAGSILMNRNETGFLRSLALSVLIPPVLTMNGAALPASATDVESWNLAGRLLTNGDSRDIDFRLAVLDQIKASRTSSLLGPEHEAQLRQNLASASAKERLIAAAALVGLKLPLGAEAAQVKAVLLQELQSREAQSYRAAQALGRMGTAAADAVPVLLAYAEATKDWPNGYASSAMEAACRLDPAVRAQHPEITARLSMEDAPTQSTAASATSFAEHLTSLYKQGEETLRRSLTSGIDSIGQLDSEAGMQARERLLAGLEQELTRASGTTHTALEKAIELVRNSPPPTQIADPVSTPLPLENLLMDARVLLVDNPHPKARQLESMFDAFREEQRSGGKSPDVTAGNFKKLAAKLEVIDPEFRKEWERAVMKNYPWLDRVLTESGAQTTRR